MAQKVFHITTMAQSSEQNVANAVLPKGQRKPTYHFKQVNEWVEEKSRPRLTRRGKMVAVVAGLALAGTGVGIARAAGSGAHSPERSSKVHNQPVDKFETYTVQPGDTLSGIAQQYTSQKHDWRQLSDDLEREVGGATIYPNQEILIPEDEISRHPSVQH